MGVTTWPCPSCGQQQREEHDNTQGVTRQKHHRLCASCLEKFLEKEGEIIEGQSSKGTKEKALDALEKEFHLS